MKRGTGFILLSTLLTISIISLLVLSCMQHILLYHKAMNALAKQHRNFYQLELVAMQLAQTKLAKVNQDCVVFSDNANQVLQQLVDREACLLTINSENYYYLIEELSDFPCLIIYRKNTKYSTHHRRVSIAYKIQDQNTHLFLQLRQINAINYLTCNESEQQVKPGISSWRYLSEN